MSMFNFGYNRRPTGLFSQLDDPANIAAIAQRRVPMAMPQDDDEEERRQRRGLFGGARRDTFLGNIMQFMNAEQGGASNWDRLAHAAAMMRDDPSFALASQRRLDGLRADYDERQARAAQQLQGFAAQKQAGHAERERLNALADSLGLQGQQRALFLMSPEDARNEFIGSRMNPEPMGAPTTRTVNRGGEIVTEQWNPQTQQFEEIGRAPRWNADAAAEGGGNSGYTPAGLSDDFARDTRPFTTMLQNAPAVESYRQRVQSDPNAANRTEDGVVLTLIGSMVQSGVLTDADIARVAGQDMRAIIADLEGFITGEGSLTPDQRQNLFRVFDSAARSARIGLRDTATEYARVAERNNIDPADVINVNRFRELEVLDFDETGQGGDDLPTYTPAEAALLPSGTRFRGTDGRIRVKD